MNKPSVFIILSLLGAVSLPSGAQQQPGAGGAAVIASAPGKATIAQTVAVTATVEAIDVASRQVTLKGPRGNSVTMTVDPQARNLAQVKVGDLVVARYYEALSLTLKKDGKELRGSTDTSDAARTAAGERPGAAATRQVEVTADVIAVDRQDADGHAEGLDADGRAQDPRSRPVQAGEGGRSDSGRVHRGAGRRPWSRRRSSG